MPFIHDSHLPISKIHDSHLPIAEGLQASNQSTMAAQTESPFFTLLPGELRNQVYNLAMTSPRPIIDPSLPPTYTPLAKAMYYRTNHHRIPDLSTQLLRTCKRVASEISLLHLYSQNTFRFTTWFSAHRFLMALPPAQRELIEDIEVDLRGVNDASPATEREWLHYLSTPRSAPSSIWEAKVGTLRSAAPGLRTLRLNIECWKVQETMRSIALLKEMLAGPKDLQRVVMMGLDGSELLFGCRKRYLSTWGPVAFVGVMRFARLAGMADWMGGCVKGERADMVVMWGKVGQRVSLEIMTREEFRVQTGRRASTLETRPCFDLEKGECMLEAYEKRWYSGRRPNDAGN